MFSKLVGGLASLSLAVGGALAAPAPRPIRPDDVLRLRVVAAPVLSPDSQWVAYTVTAADEKNDKFVSQVHLARVDGSEDFQATFGKQDASNPRFSPDGRYLSFLSARAGDDEDEDLEDVESQLFLLRRSGGEAVRVSALPGGVEDYDWAPDAKSLVLVGMDPDPNRPKSKADKKKTKPIVTSRYHFKQDVVGYLTERRSHLYLFDLETRKAQPLTSGPFDHSLPRFSPDGRQLAFVSARGAADPDRTGNTDVFVIDVKAGAEPRRLTTWEGPDNPRDSSRLAWSPDGSLIAYLQGDETRFFAYNQDVLAVVPVAGGPARILTAALDRPVSNPLFSRDGKELFFLVTDDRTQCVAKIAVGGGAVLPAFKEKRIVSGLDLGADGRLVLAAASLQEPAELFVLEGSSLRRLTHHNDGWLAELALGQAEEFTSTSKDGTLVNGVVTRPHGASALARLPAVLLIHGGPDGQDGYEFDHEREVLAAAGYLVIQANYRGSNGRGAAYQKAIYADWGHKEVVDLLGALDHFIARGLADPARVASVGWSYGGILTNYLIASDPRFKAAASTAGSSMQVLWGLDQYTMQYEHELGPPWKAQDLYLKVSYPFFHADRIKTPTLFLGGEKDFNVPIAGGEQMYQALKSLGIATELVVYPGLFHGLAAPGAIKDRLERQLAWLGKYLNTADVAR